MPTTFELTLDTPDAGPVCVAVTRKRVKNLNLRIHADGTATLSIPARATKLEAKAFLERRADWIGKHVSAARSHAEKQCGDQGEATGIPANIPLWGHSMPIAEALAREPKALRAIARPATFGANVRANAAKSLGEALPRLTPEQLTAAIDILYRSELERTLPAVAAKMEARIGAHANRWSLRRMKSRWGSCTPKTRAIRINTQLAAYPPECLEMVVAHELVHLLEPSHNARFHALLDTHCPANRKVSRILKMPASAVADKIGNADHGNGRQP